MAEERIIVALDVDMACFAGDLISQLLDAVTFKVGHYLTLDEDFLHLVMDHEFSHHPLMEQRRERTDFFVDYKYFDIPETVFQAVKHLTGRPQIKMCTVHAEKSVMAAAAKAAKGTDLKILSVPLLTSMAGPELTDFFNYPWSGCAQDFVLERVEWALRAGCHGTICSAQEVAAIRERVPDEFLIIVPGTRSDKVSHHDHKRTGSPRKAIDDGATHLVVGRQIILDPDPAEAFARLVVEIS